MDKEDRERLIRLEVKQDQILDSIGELKVDLIPIKKHVSMVQGVGAFIGVSASLMGIAGVVWAFFQK